MAESPRERRRFDKDTNPGQGALFGSGADDNLCTANGYGPCSPQESSNPTRLGRRLLTVGGASGPRPVIDGSAERTN